MSQIFTSSTSSPPPPSVPTSFVTDDGTATPASNILNIIGGIGIETEGSGDTITINVATQGDAWSEQTTDFLAQIENGYFCNNALIATLPATAGLVIGNSVLIYVDTTGTVTVQANTGQFIQVGSNISVSAGIASSSTRGAILELIFKPSDSTWHTISSMGVWSVT